MPEELPAPHRHILRLLIGFVLAFLTSVGLATAAGAVITGVDVASYQHPGGAAIDWNQVRGAGHRFAYVKATEGTSYTNPYFSGDWAGIAAAGLYRGAYHYARPALPLSTATDQARYFVSRTGAMTGAQDLPGELDLEETGGLNQADLAQWTREFLAEVTRLTGKKPLVYTGRWFWQGNIGSYGNDIGQNYRLWTADYHCQRQDGSLFCDPTTDTYNPPIYGGWSQWTFWQNYSVGSVPGIIGNVDMNRFCCDLGSLAALAGAGSTGGSPFGSLDAAVLTSPNVARIAGWAIDPDTTAAIAVHFYTDGAFAGATSANGVRSDVSSAYPGFAGNHGFSIDLAIPTGARQVCAYGINVGSGVNSQLGCASLGGNPLGSFDVATLTRPGRVTVAGWAFDPNDTTRSIPVHVYIGAAGTAISANLPRGDVNTLFNITGNHAFNVELPAAGGTQQVCAYAVNDSGPGSNVPLGCKTVVVPAGNPIAGVDLVAARVGTIDVGGWAIDPDTADPTQVHVYVDGVGYAINANGWRGDVGSVHPLYGPNHGYSASLPAAAGARQVCLHAVNIAGSGSNVPLGCRTVNVPSPEPFGSLDAATGGYGSLSVAGWAIDPDTAAPTQVHVYVDGVGYAVNANAWRGDIAALYPAFGPAHGFNFSVAASGGSHQVCVYAINTAGQGSNQGLSCRTVNVADGSPIGSVDWAISAYGHIAVSGWALDPDTSAPIPVHIYVNGVGVGMLAADYRGDVAAAFGRGPSHGYTYVAWRASPAPQTICVFGINSAGSGTNSLLGCRVV